MYATNEWDGHTTHFSFGSKFTITGDYRSPHFFIGLEEQFVPGNSLYRLTGERKDVWRKLARPADEHAFGFFRDEVGSYLARVINRPTWVFDTPPSPRASRFQFEPEIRLVDGLLCGTRNLRHELMGDAIDLDRNELIDHIVRTEDGCFDCRYHRPAGSREASLVSQKPWTPSRGIGCTSHLYRKYWPRERWSEEPLA